MNLTAKDLKAINWYITEKKLKPLLSNPPQMYFRDKDGIALEPIYLGGIVLEYNAWNEEDKKQRAHEKKVAAIRRVIKSATNKF